MRWLGRLGLSFVVGCWSVALWAVLLGASPVRTTADEKTWWPGGLYGLLVMAAVFAALQVLPWLSDWLQRACAQGVAIWAAAAAFGLALMVGIRWEAPITQFGALAGLELFALSMAGVVLAGITAPPLPPPVRLGLPPMIGGEAAASAEASTRTIVWVGTGTGYTPVEPYAVDVVIDSVRLEAQKVAPHDLVLPRWPQYCAVTPEVRHLAGEIRTISRREGLDRLEEVRLALGMVAEGLGPLGPGEVPLYPLETLAAEAPAGSAARCILGAALLKAMGYRPALLQAGNRTALAVAGAYPLPDLFLQVEGQPGLYAEFTPEGPICGDAPPGARAIQWQALPLRD